MISGLRFIAVLVIAVLAFELRTVCAQEDRADSTSVLQLDAGLGFAEHQRETKNGYWYPLRVTIRAIRSDVEGQVSITQDGNPMVGRIGVSVRKGTTKRYEFPFRPSNEFNSQAPIKVTLNAGRLGQDDLILPLQFMNAQDRSVNVIADDPAGFSFFSRHQRSGSPVWGMVPEQALAYGSPEFLPEEPLLYEGLTLIVISSSQLRQIRPEQWKAVLTWVEHGGRLLIAVGHHQPFYAQSDLPKLLGRTFGPSEPMTFDSDGASTGSLQVLYSPPEFEIEAEADRLLRLGGRDIIFGSRRGRGWLGFSLVALDRAVLAAIAALPNGERVWRTVAGPGPVNSAAIGLARNNEGSIGALLQMPYMSNLAGLGWIASFAGLYILLAVPLNWFVWSRLKRREWAWPTALLLAAIFTWYAYTTGMGRAGKDSRASRVTIISRPQQSQSVRKIAFSMIYTPRRMRESVEIGGPLGLPAPLSSFFNPYLSEGQRNPYEGRDFTLSGPNPLLLDGFVVYPSSARGMRMDAIMTTSGTMTVTEPIALGSEMSGVSIAGSLRNDTLYTFNRGYLIHGDALWRISKPVAPGAVISLGQDMQRIPTDVSMALRDDLRTVIRPVRQQLDRDSQSNMDYYLQMILTGWTPHEQMSALDDQSARFIGLTLKIGPPGPSDLETDENEDVLLYEEDLAITSGTGLRNVGENSEMGGDWRLRLGEAAFISNQQNIGWMYAYQQQGRTTDSLILVPDEYILSVIPPVGIDPATIDSMTLHMRIDPFPTTEAPMNHGENRYRLVGCPLAVFDFANEAWHSLGDFQNDPIVFKEPGRFMDAATGFMLLKFDAVAEKLLLAQLNSDGKAAKIETNKHIFGQWYAGSAFQIGDLHVDVKWKPAEEVIRD